VVVSCELWSAAKAGVRHVSWGRRGVPQADVLVRLPASRTCGELMQFFPGVQREGGGGFCWISAAALSWLLFACMARCGVRRRIGTCAYDTMGRGGGGGLDRLFPGAMVRCWHVLIFFLVPFYTSWGVCTTSEAVEEYPTLATRIHHPALPVYWVFHHSFSKHEEQKNASKPVRAPVDWTEYISLPNQG